MPDKNFLETYPLYKKLTFEVPERMVEIPKPKISFICDVCSSMQTYVMMNEYFAEFQEIRIEDTPSVQSLTLLTYFCGFHPACRVRGVLG